MIYDENGNRDEETFEKLQKVLLNLPIYLKAIDIYDTMLLISDNIFTHHRNANNHRLMFDNSLIEESKQLVLNINSMELVKITFIKNKSDYSNIFERMLSLRLFLSEFENNINNIWDIHNCPEHYATLKNEFDEFKLLYFDWIKTFDLSKGYKDDWGFSITFS